MADNKWDDDKVEKILHSLPKIVDERSQSDILNRLKKDPRLKKKTSPRILKKWIPGIVAIAALLFLSFLVPSMMNDNIGQKDISSEKMMTRGGNTSNTPSEAEESSSLFDHKSTENATFSIKSMASSHVVLEDLNYQEPLFHMGLVHEATVIPVTFLMQEEEITSNFPDGNPTSLELYRKYAQLVNEKELGFDEYHPYHGILTESGNTITHQVSESHNYDSSPATIEVYTNSAIATFGDYTDFKVTDANGVPTVFDYLGLEMEFALKQHSAYFKYVMDSGMVYLIPYAAGDIATVEDALLAMQHPDNDIVETVVPESVTYTVEENDDKVVLTFNDSLDLSLFLPDEAMEMIEGFMLTVSSFDKKLELKNVQQDHFENYDLTKPLPKPAGANPILWN